MAIPLTANDLPDLATDFWNWRVYEQPFSEDDIPRLDRPQDFVIDWSPEKVAQRRTELAALEGRWKAINTGGESIANQVDYRLIGSALARARWELDIEQGWKRNPVFYVQSKPWERSRFRFRCLFDAARRFEPPKPTKSGPNTIKAVRRAKSPPTCDSRLPNWRLMRWKIFQDVLPQL